MDQKTVVHLHNGILSSRKKEGAPTLCNSMHGTGEHTLSEISQAVKDKYHMISPISRTYSTKQASKQNITRDIEIKNKLTVTRGEVGGDNGGKGGRVFKEHVWTKSKGVGSRVGGWHG